MNLKNKKVIITGATGGIGNSLVEKFYNYGSSIVATGTNEEKLNNLKKKYPNILIEKFKFNVFGSPKYKIIRYYEASWKFVGFDLFKDSTLSQKSPTTLACSLLQQISLNEIEASLLLFICPGSSGTILPLLKS